ncbi:MAG: hypothetical protein JJT78_07585 [Leptospira sp.]|nr:hypothetical protein [Leptospira sp.]
MKIILALVSILSSFLFLDCSKEVKEVYTPRPQTRPNTHIRKLEIDQIREGDSVVKASAILGQPTFKKSTQNGTEMIWYFIPVKYQEDSYETLKKVPKETEGVPFLKLMIGTDNKITTREFEI